MPEVRISVADSSASSQKYNRPSSQAFDGNTTIWAWWATPGGHLTNEWVAGHFDSGQIVNRIRYYASVHVYKNIKHAKVEGSNDGVNWTKIPAIEWSEGASRYNGDEILFASAEGWQEVVFNNEVSYTRYRLFCYDAYIELSETPVHIVVSELEFYYDDNKPSVTSFAIDEGASSTKDREVTLDNICTGEPTHYMASEDPDFVLSEIWQGNHDLATAGNQVQDFDAGSSVDWELFSLTVQVSTNIQFRSKSAATQGDLAAASYGAWQDGITGSITAGNNRWLRVEIRDTTYIPAGYIPIYDVDDLQAMNDDLTANYWLMNDIDASETSGWNAGTGFQPIGGYFETPELSPFTGIFDGNGHTITDLYINRYGYPQVGLFGKTLNAEIKNVGLINVGFTGMSYAGALIGRSNATTVDNCSSTGTIYSYEHNVGGLIGNIEGNSTITNSSSTCSVTRNAGAGSGDTGCGGFSGRCESSTITNCYSTGLVISNRITVGGFNGVNSGGTYNDDFWDTETSGQATSAGGTGKTTAQMKQEATFTNWDFVTIWAIVEDVSYPTLR